MTRKNNIKSINPRRQSELDWKLNAFAQQVAFVRSDRITRVDCGGFSQDTIIGDMIIEAGDFLSLRTNYEILDGGVI